MSNTISDNLIRLQTTKSSISTAIANKGVTVPSGSGFEDFSNLINQIPSTNYNKIAYALYDMGIINNINSSETDMINGIYNMLVYSSYSKNLSYVYGANSTGAKMSSYTLTKNTTVYIPLIVYPYTNMYLKSNWTNVAPQDTFGRIVKVNRMRINDTYLYRFYLYISSVIGTVSGTLQHNLVAIPENYMTNNPSDVINLNAVTSYAYTASSSDTYKTVSGANITWNDVSTLYDNYNVALCLNCTHNHSIYFVNTKSSTYAYSYFATN